jgi:FKBP-type peptidyl-prolyl cis-trans isomerase (trigger factor)
MNITVEKQPNCNASLLVEVPSDAVQSERNKIIKTYTAKARIKGFRPGKVPRKVIEKRFGTSISSELLDRLARQAFDKATQELKVLDFGRPSDFKQTPDGSVTFRAQLTLAPEIKLPNYKGITITAGSTDVTADEVDVRVKEIKEISLPELDDEFAAKVTGGKDLEELKSRVEQQLGVEKKSQVEDAKVNQIVEYFNELVDFELPEKLVREETQSQANSLIQRGVQPAMSEEEIAAQQAEIFATAAMQARTHLKTNFILQEVARIENIVVADDELLNHLATVAQSRKENPKKMIKQLQKEGRIPGIRNSMLVGKAIDFVLEHANVEEASATTEDQAEKS